MDVDTMRRVKKSKRAAWAARSDLGSGEGKIKTRQNQCYSSAQADAIWQVRSWSTCSVWVAEKIVCISISPDSPLLRLASGEGEQDARSREMEMGMSD